MAEGGAPARSSSLVAIYFLKNLGCVQVLQLLIVVVAVVVIVDASCEVVVVVDLQKLEVNQIDSGSILIIVN